MNQITLEQFQHNLQTGYTILHIYDYNDVLILHIGIKYRVRLRCDNIVEVIHQDYTREAAVLSSAIAKDISTC